METRLRVLLLTALALNLGGCATVHRMLHRAPASDSAQAADSASGTGSASTGESAGAPGEDTPPRVIQPDVERRTVKVPRIKSQDYEIGAYGGSLNVEDFGAHPAYGIQLGYHVTEDFFLQADAGRSHAGRSSFEVLSNVSLLSSNERWFKYYSLSLGYNFLPGEVFLGRDRAMPSSFFVLAGVGSTDFGGDSKFTGNIGAGFKVLPLDWLAVHVAVTDRVFNSDLLGTNKLTSNLEAHLGLSVFF